MKRALIVCAALGMIVVVIAGGVATAYLLARQAEELFPGGGRLSNILILMLVFVMGIATLLTMAERKWSAMIQNRIGPNRARLGLPGLRNYALAGVPHIAADVLKMFFKENFLPALRRSARRTHGGRSGPGDRHGRGDSRFRGSVPLRGRFARRLRNLPGRLVIQQQAGLAGRRAGFVPDDQLRGGPGPFPGRADARLLHGPASGDDRCPNALPVAHPRSFRFWPSRLGHLPSAGGLRALLRRGDGGNEASPIRRARGRIGDHRLLRGILRNEVRDVHDRRVRRGGGALGSDGGDLPRGIPSALRRAVAFAAFAIQGTSVDLGHAPGNHLLGQGASALLAATDHPLDIPPLPLRSDPDAWLEDVASGRAAQRVHQRRTGSLGSVVEIPGDRGIDGDRHRPDSHRNDARESRANRAGHSYPLESHHIQWPTTLLRNPNKTSGNGSTSPSF